MRDEDQFDRGPSFSLDVIPLHSTTLLTVLDPSGIIRYESPSIARIFGYDQAELVGDSVAEYFHPDDRDHVVDAYQTVVESNSHVIEAVEYRHRQADGSYRWVESIASADPTVNGNYVINTRDIADWKAKERELQRTNERLAEFASVVSHDLRSPLSVADGRIELAREECDSDHLEHADRAIDRGLALLDELQSLAKDGDHIGSIESVSLADTAAECWRTVHTAEATLVTETETQLSAVPGRLKQLLENLIRNAVTHGGDDVTITVGDIGDGFFVADDGPGIPIDDRDRVFEVGHSTADTGTGIGLSIVKQIADTHGWDIAVTESDGGGARFEISGIDHEP